MPGPWGDKGRGRAVCVGGVSSKPWLFCRAQPACPPPHTHTHTHTHSLGRGQVDCLWCPSNDSILDHEGSRACPFQGQVTGEPRASPTLSERRSQARGDQEGVTWASGDWEEPTGGP